MTERAQILAAMQAKLEAAGIPFDDLKVFGAIRCNVHVKAVSRDTATLWASLLTAVFKGSKVSVVPTVWEAKENRNSVLNPTMRKGFLIAVAA